MKLFGYLSVMLAAGSMAFGQESESRWNEDLLMEGDALKFQLGTYFEDKDYREADNDYGYITLWTSTKYQTGKMLDDKLQLGVEVFTHTKVSNWDSPGKPDNAFDNDIEKNWFVPEAWLAYNFTDDNKLVLGRFNHKKISHLDDTHSEGFYFESKYCDCVSFVFGGMTRFAEIDYDDGEDFGRKDNKQDLSHSRSYGSDSSSWVFYFEGHMEPKEGVKFNPFVYHQDGYATLWGMDVNLEYRQCVHNAIGARLSYNYVDADTGSENVVYNFGETADDLSDAQSWAIAPYVQLGDWKFTIGHANFDGDGDSSSSTAMNKPMWFADYLIGVLDQDNEYGAQNQTVDFAEIKWAPADAQWWVSTAAGEYKYGFDREARCTEMQLRSGYKFDSGLKCEARLIKVKYNTEGAGGPDSDDADYNKVELLASFAF